MRAEQAALVDGAYVAVASHVYYDGWVPVLMADVADGRLHRVAFDLLNHHGDYLSMQSYHNTSVDQAWLAFLEPMAHAWREDPHTLAEFALPSKLAETYRALAETVLSQAATGEMEMVQVPVAASGQASDITHLAPWLAWDYRQAAATALRAGMPRAREGGGIAVVASHHAAVEAGMEILRQGGTAADAAVTVAVVMSVVEPYFSSPLGGGTWLLYFDAETATVSALDGVGPAPRAAELELFQDNRFSSPNGIHRANVPGSWGAYMELLKRYGSYELDTILAPAIELAEAGVPIHAGYSRWLSYFDALIRSWPYAAAIYAPEGTLLEEGDYVYYHDLANTYRELSQTWAAARHRGERAALEAASDYFYRGSIAERIVAFSEENGGLFTYQDFSEFRDYGFVEPLSVDYRGYDIYQNPPNSQGIAQLQALRILEGFDFSAKQPDDPDVTHVIAEAIKLAFVDRNRYVADPNTVDVPVERLLSRTYAYQQRQRISLDAVLEWPIEDRLGLGDERGNTTTFHLVDRYGNAAAVTTSIGASFLVAGDTGIHFNERLTFMNIDPEDINHIAPGKKVRHTSSPYMVLRDGRPWLLGGNTGADFQPQGQLQQLMWIVDFGLTAQEAIDQPRFEAQAFASTMRPWDTQTLLRLEAERFSVLQQESLAGRGHRVLSGGTIGAANMLRIEDQAIGQIEAASESRQAQSLGLVERVYAESE